MNDAALLAAILDSPDDDLPRLAYADWLEEHGEQDRAEFVRLQLELAKWPEWSLPYQRAHALDFDRAWGVGRTDLPELPAKLEWEHLPLRRGFPEKLSGTIGSFLKHAERVFAVAPVRSFRVNQASSEAIGRLARSPLLSRLRFLSITSSGLTEPAVRALGESRHAVNLEGLELCGETVSGYALEALVATPLFARLRWLNLNQADRISAGAHLGRAAARRGKLCRLEGLNLSQTQCTAADLAAVLDSPLPAGLTELKLRNCSVGARGWQRLTRCEALGRLCVLDATCGSTGRRAVRHLLEAPWAANLRWLEFALNPPGEDGSEAMRLLAGAECLAGLTVLDWGFNRAGDEGARALERSPYLTGLVNLDLMYNNLSEEMVLRLVDAPVLANVVSLNVRGNNLGPKANRNLRRRRRRQIWT